MPTSRTQVPPYSTIGTGGPSRSTIRSGTYVAAITIRAALTQRLARQARQRFETPVNQCLSLRATPALNFLLQCIRLVDPGELLTPHEAHGLTSRCVCRAEPSRVLVHAAIQVGGAAGVVRAVTAFEEVSPCHRSSVPDRRREVAAEAKTVDAHDADAHGADHGGFACKRPGVRVGSLLRTCARQVSIRAAQSLPHPRSAHGCRPTQPSEGARSAHGCRPTQPSEGGTRAAPQMAWREPHPDG